MATDLCFDEQDLALARELGQWLAEHRPDDGPAGPAASDVDLAATVERGRRWQAELAAAGFVGVDWPAAYGGRGASPVQLALVNAQYAASGAPQLVNRVGVNLVAPTLLAHGSVAQCRRWLPSIASAGELWCQLFSEPDAGSDLASLSTRATRDGEGWRVSGRKVWTSYAQFADFGLCLARTDPASRGARGLSMLVVDMHAPGVVVRPLVQITGDAEFNEVTLDDVVVPADHLIGAEHTGWQVARSTLARERGINPRQLVLHRQRLEELWRLAVDTGAVEDTRTARRLAASAVDVLVFELHTWRAVDRAERGQPPGPESSVVKVHWSEASVRLHRLALDILGPAAPLGPGADGAVADGAWARAWLYAHASTIFSGTNEIQRTLVGEQVLGLPRPPRPEPAEPATRGGSSVTDVHTTPAPAAAHAPGAP
jgi:alkylation response protein AidB-like acyl-CoA dehydrogenase